MEFEQFFLIAAYVPNSKEGLSRLDYRVNQWDKDFFKFIKSKETTGKAVIITGDLNVALQEIDVHNPTVKNAAGFTPEERNSWSKFIEGNYIDTYRNLYPSKIEYT